MQQETVDNVCPISMETMKESHTLECGHTFEKIYVQKWLEKNDSCPLCRRTQSTSENDLISLEQDIMKFREMFFEHECDDVKFNERIKNIDVKKTRKQMERLGENGINQAINFAITAMSIKMGNNFSPNVLNSMNTHLRNIINELGNDNNNCENMLDIINIIKNKNAEKSTKM